LKQSPDSPDDNAVEKARELKIKIVTYDWLEDSLMSKPYRPKREGPYLWDRILRERDDTYKVTKNGKKGRRGVDMGMKLLTKQMTNSLTPQAS
jgi:hypothetical protein